jgi:ABC-type nitrate/sulfonate/bicarbonate transport system permease component
MFGLGFMIFDARTFLATDIMYAGIILVGVLGYSIETFGFGYLDKRTTERWGMVKGT